MSVQNKIYPPAANIAERKEQLREALTQSGLFTFDREFDAETDLYFCNYNPLYKCRFDYIMRSSSASSVTPTTLMPAASSKTYLYPASHDDSGNEMPLAVNCFIIGNHPNQWSTGYLPKITDSLNVMWVKNPGFTYLYLHNTAFIGYTSQKGHKFMSVCSADITTNGYPPIYGVSKLPTLGTSFTNISSNGAGTPSSKILGYYQNIHNSAVKQYTFLQKITLDKVREHDRILQHQRPLDYEIDIFETIYANPISADFVTDDVIPYIVTWSNSGNIPLRTEYHDTVSGKKYLTIGQNVMVEVFEGEYIPPDGIEIIIEED